MEHRKVAPLALLAAAALTAAACLALGDLRRHRLTPPPSSAPVAQPRSLFDMRQPSNKDGYYKWMWADVGLFGAHELAEADPFRWSDWLNAVGIIADLEAYKTQSQRNQIRPVELLKGSAGNDRNVVARPMKFGNIDEAIAYLSAQTTTPAPTVVEKIEKVAIAGQRADAAHLNSPEALCYMALGSALTLALYALYSCCACTLRRTCGFAKDDADHGLLDDTDSDEESKPRLALTDARAPQPYQGVLQDSELRALLADIEEEERRMITGPRSFAPDNQNSAAMREEASREVERVLRASSAREIFGGGHSGEQRAQYRRLVRLFHPDKKVLEGQRASLALRRVVESYRALPEGS